MGLVPGQRTEFCKENAVVIANTLFQQHKRWLSHGHHQIVNTKIKLISFFVVEDGEAVYSQQKQDQEPTAVGQVMNFIAKFRHKLKKVGKTTKSFRYDLSQIPYNYTVQSEITQSCPTLCDPMDYTLPGS